jgi:hypothetical protein
MDSFLFTRIWVTRDNFAARRNESASLCGVCCGRFDLPGELAATFGNTLNVLSAVSLQKESVQLDHYGQKIEVQFPV